MLDDRFNFVVTEKRRRKPERRKATKQWMGYDEDESDFEAIKPRKQKNFRYEDYEDYGRLASRNLRPNFRKNPHRKEKWAFDERDF